MEKIVVGTRVRVRPEHQAALGLNEGQEGTVRAVYPLSRLPLDVQWDGEDYSSFWYRIGTYGQQVYDRTEYQEVEVVS